MLVHRLNRFGEGLTHVLSIINDPHGEQVYIWTSRRTLWMVDVLSLLKYFELYRY